MTNREWLNSISDDEYCKWMFSDHGYYQAYNEETHEFEYKFYSYYPTKCEICHEYANSYEGMKEWLKEERSVKND